jgi:hypothetical protein
MQAIATAMPLTSTTLGDLQSEMPVSQPEGRN